MPSSDKAPRNEVRIQQSGALLIIDPGWQIHACSENLAQVLGLDHTVVAGESLGDAVGHQFAHDSRGWAQGLDGQSNAVRHLSYTGQAGTLDLSITQAAGNYVVSLEPARDSKPVGRDALVQRFLSKLRPLDSVHALADGAAMLLRMFTQSDHVAIAEIADDASVRVLAQSGVKSFALQASYPQLDQLLPQLVDHDAPGMIVDTLDRGVLVSGKPGLDLDAEVQSSPLRRPGPSALCNLNNQGVRSALWFPLLTGKGTTGFVLCRRATPHHCDAARRAATELATHFLALMIQERKAGL